MLEFRLQQIVHKRMFSLRISMENANHWFRLWASKNAYLSLNVMSNVRTDNEKDKRNSHAEHNKITKEKENAVEICCAHNHHKSIRNLCTAWISNENLQEYNFSGANLETCTENVPMLQEQRKTFSLNIVE